MDYKIVAEMLEQLIPTLQLPSLTTLLVIAVTLCDRSWSWIFNDPTLGPPSVFTVVLIFLLTLFTSLGLTVAIGYILARLIVSWAFAPEYSD